MSRPSLLALGLGLAALLAPAAKAAPLPLVLSHSGFLLDASDQPVNEQSLAMTFRIYDQDAPVGSQNLVWSAACTVTVRSGYYGALLGSTSCGAGLDTSHLPIDAARYLEVSVGSVALLPRMRVTSAPSAAVAARSLDAEALKTALAEPGTLNAETNPVDWTKLKNVPTSLTGGAITTGTWEGAPIADTYVASASAWNAKLSTVTHDGTLAGDGTQTGALSVVYGNAAGTAAQGNDPRLSDARAPTAGSANYIQNGTAAQAASMNITGTAEIGGAGRVGGALTTNSQFRSVPAAGSTHENTGTEIDWNNGNVQTTTAGCGAFTFSNMAESGAYTLIVKGAASGTCTFSQSSPDTVSTFKFMPANGATTAGTTSVYTFLRARNVVYVSWITGF